ncbi:unnamed protein product [Paramecium primaurelia]|uniref:Uncharacterized protein n=1 Tax=Paramecium primaurelia TaxID=5886 RepID=A0A8S1QGR5_PARPR|nr:unnamed protein product [Paramecium primaurelia]
MKLISLLIHSLFSFIYIICQNTIIITQYSELQQLYFLENEKYIIEENDLAIPFKNDEDLQRKLLNTSSQQLIQKQKQIDLGLDDDATLFKFLSHQGKYINICVLQLQSIDCKIRINNTLYNEGIIAEEIRSNPISLPSNSCYNAFYIEEDSFLIHCLNSNQQIQYFLLNDKSQILDEITINEIHNCRLDSKLQSNKLLINSLNCQISIILIIEINLQDGRLQFNKNFTKLHELDTYPNHSNLIDLKICDQNIVLLIFAQFMCTYNLENQLFKNEMIQYQPWFLYIKDSCFPYVMNQQFKGQNRIEYYYPTFNQMINTESQIKSIQYSGKIFLFLYDDYAIITHENFNQKRILNIKQIYKLNTLPLLLTLDYKNQISFYNIICLNKFIQYQNLPFIGIYQKSQLKYYTNQILFYYKMFQYTIIYPLQIELTESITIKNNQRDITNLIIYTNQISKAIPLYLDLEFDQDNVLQEYQNQTIIIYHRNLPIKKILKIISFEINFIIIIYEDQYHKIYVNLKNKDIQKNVYIMSSTFEVSVEFLKEDINQITLFFITKNKILNFLIINKTEIEYQDSIKPKDYIQEYKMDLYKIICLLIDNTVLTYQFKNWYEYFSAKNQYLQEFWMKRENKYNDFRVPYLYIDHQKYTIEIQSLIPNKYNILVTLNSEILISHIFVPYTRILLIVNNNNILELKLYFFSLNEILLLYQIPTYEFLILQPIKIKFYDKLFSIITIKNEQEYLLTYDVTKQGKSSLIQITKMQLDYQSFNLIDETGILSQVLFDKIVINYPYLNFGIKQIKISDQSIIDHLIKFQAKSLIQSIPSYFYINLNLLNFDTKLRYKLNVKQQMLMINNQNEIINLDSIYGSINNLYLSNNCEGFLNGPIQLKQIIQLNNCQSIYEQFCFVSNSTLIIDYFNSNITIILPNYTILLNTILKSNNNLIILYNHQFSQIGFFNFSGNQSIQQNIYNDSNYIKLDYIQFNNKYKSIRFINDILMIETAQFLGIYSIIRQQNKMKQEVQCQVNYLSVKQIEYLFYYEYSFILLILKNEFELCFEICSKFENEDKQHKKIISDFQIVAFHILNIKQENQEIHLILILFSPRDFAYIYELFFDLKQQIITEQIIKSQIIRYININYEDFKQINETNFILKGKNENSTSSSYFYQMNLSSSIEIFDYYYKDDEFSDIQYYNQTHFVQIKNDGKINNIQLIEIHNYQINLQNNCELVLHNYVSSLRSPVILQYSIQNKSKTTLYLLMLNFPLILFISNKKNRSL